MLQLLARPGALISRNELLDAIWGHRYVTPSTLNRLIALTRRAFGDDSEVPRFVQTVHGAGYRFIGSVEQMAQSLSEPPVRFAPPPTAKLPVRVEALIGREQELAALANLFREHRAITVLGTGGMGKTQCALEAARELAADMPDGVWFFDLVPMHHGSEWLQSLASALAIPASSTDEMLGKIVPLLQGRRALLVLDNCDRIATEVGALVLAILQRTDSVKVLSTSQLPLNFIGEQLMRLPPLALPVIAADDIPNLDQIGMAPAMKMLLLRVQAVQPTFALTSTNARCVVEICQRLDGIPLALELAAARFELLSPVQVLERLEHRFRFLNSEATGRELRHRNLASLLDWSYGLLSPAEQRLLLWCSVFVQGWTVEQAVGFADAVGSDPETVVDLLTGLVKKSLVSAVPGLSPPRYQLLESVRDYALERLRSTGEEPRARAAHQDIFVRVCQAAHRDILDGHMRQCVEQLIHEHGNIAAALEYEPDSVHGRTAVMSIVGALILYIKARGVYLTAQTWCQRALAGSAGDSSVERGRALLCLGVATFYGTAGKEVVGDMLAEAARIAREHADLWTEGYADGLYALWLANGGNATQAFTYVANTARIGEQTNDAILRGLAGLAHGWLYIARGDQAAAIVALRAVRDLSHDLHQQHFIDMYIGLAHFALRELPAAARQWQEAMRRAAEVSNIRGVAGSIEGCAYIAAQTGRYPQAARLLAAAARFRERTGSPLFNFWLPHHDQAQMALRSSMAAGSYDEATAAGRAMREEDAAAEARALLDVFALAATPTTA